MSLVSQYKPSTRLDHMELDGLLSVLSRRIEEAGENGEAITPYYIGAHIALSIVRYHEFVDTQHDFMRLFERLFENLEGGR